MVLWFRFFFFQIPRTNGSLIQIFFFQIPRTSGSVIQNLFKYPESWFWFFQTPGTGSYFGKHQRTTPHWLAPFLLSFWKFSNSSKLEFFWAQNLKHLNMLIIITLVIFFVEFVISMSMQQWCTHAIWMNQWVCCSFLSPCFHIKIHPVRDPL